MLFICIDTIENDEFFEEFIYDGKETGYMVSNYGRVWSLKTNKFMSYHYGRDGRKRVHLQINGKGKKIIHPVSGRCAPPPGCWEGRHCTPQGRGSSCRTL